MTTHLYCILPGENSDMPPLDLSGVRGERVRTLPVQDMVAWVSDVEREPPVSVEDVRAHDGVVEAALQTGATPVPARFGQRFASDEACGAALASRATALQEVVFAVQGCVEMTLVLTPSTRRMLRDLQPVLPELIEGSGPGPGKAYLHMLRAREAATGTVRRAMDALAGRLIEATRSLVRETKTHDQGPRLPLQTLSQLIARPRVEDYQRAVSAVEPGREFRFLVIGPRAPYSFCSLGADGGMHGMKLAD